MQYQLSMQETLKAWLRRLYKTLQQAPLVSRASLYIGTDRVGTIEMSIAQALLDAGLLEQDGEGLVLQQETAQPQLEKIALWLRENQLCNRWTNELLPVTNAAAETVACIERAVVRTMGIMTHAAYLIGTDQNDRIWLQRRSLLKATNPGKLDLLVGGLVARNETCGQALEREAYEEAGLDLRQLFPPAKGGVTYICCPVDCGYGGYMVEQGHWYEATLPPTFKPVNQDGEVSGFMLCTPDEIRQHMLADDFAPEAAWVLARYLGW